MTGPLAPVYGNLMRPTPAIVRPAVDLGWITSQIVNLNSEINAGERALDERRKKLGKLLIEARKAFHPSTSPNNGWAEWVEGTAGISSRTAHRYMALVTVAAQASAAGQPEPSTYADAGLERRRYGNLTDEQIMARAQRIEASKVEASPAGNASKAPASPQEKPAACCGACGRPL